MSCERPLIIRNPRYDESNLDDWRRFFFIRYGRKGIPDGYIEVPCGKCASCRRSRLNGWRVRLLAEFERYASAIFVTFTFDDEYLEKFKDNPNRAVRLWLDRSRKAYGFSFRHFFIAEYGSDDEYIDARGRKRRGTGRLHYHGLLFGRDFMDYTKFKELWKYGHIFLCKVPNDKRPSIQNTVNYIVKYLTKDPKDLRPVPRIIVSKGIGACYVDKYGDDHYRDLRTYILYKGKYRVPLPLYLRNKIFDELDRFDLAEIRRLSPYCRMVCGKPYYDEVSYRKALAEFSSSQILLGLSPAPAPPGYKEPKKQVKKSALSDYRLKFEDF